MDNIDRFPLFRPFVTIVVKIGLGCLLLFGAAWAATVSAATIPVSAGAVDNSINGNCSIIEAIRSANSDTSEDNCIAGSGADELVLATSTYNLTSTYTTNEGENGLPLITSEILISGNNSIIKPAAGATDTFRFFYITSTGKLSIFNLTVRGGIADDDIGTGRKTLGGAFFVNQSTLTLTNCTIENNQARRGVAVTSGGGAIFTVSNPSDPAGPKIAVVDMVGTTLSSNHTDDDGGGLLAVFGSQVTVKGSTIKNNTCGDQGGGLQLYGSDLFGLNLIIENSIFTDNEAKEGGAIFASGFPPPDAASNVSISDSTFSGNQATHYGGGIYSWGLRPLTITRTEFTENEADAFGGGAIRANNGSEVIINSCTIDKNGGSDHGGGLEIWESTAMVNDSTISGNTVTDYGGGILCYNGALDLIRSTISDNEATGPGGGIQLEGCTASLQNSTCSFNHAGSSGGGIGVFVGSTLNLLYTTVASNIADANNDSLGSGGGVYNSASTINATNSIIADNLKYLTGEDCSSLAVNGTNVQNWFEDDTCTGAGTGKGNPQLAPLANNGGPTQTQAIQAGSGAIDQITSANCQLSNDQRGYHRPSGTYCDIGAYEYQKGSFFILPSQKGKPTVIYLD